MLAFLRELFFGWIYRRRLRLPTLDTAQLWAIAAGANLARLNGSSLTSLHTTSLPSSDRHVLERWWAVTDLASLREKMDWLANEGHRAGFKEIHAALFPATRGEGVAIPEEAVAVAPFIVRNYTRFKNGSLLAWDLARLINVARFGFTAGYLPEAEAWQVIMLAAKGLATEYASWEELSDNYLLGFSYWQNGAEPDQFLVEAANWLKSDAESPWRNIPWSGDSGLGPLSGLAPGIPSRTVQRPFSSQMPRTGGAVSPDTSALRPPVPGTVNPPLAKAELPEAPSRADAVVERLARRGNVLEDYVDFVIRLLPPRLRPWASAVAVIAAIALLFALRSHSCGDHRP